MNIGDVVVEKLKGTPRMKVVGVDGNDVTVRYYILEATVTRVIPADLLALVPKRT